MTDSPRISRREWFRLQLPKSGSQAKVGDAGRETSMGQEGQGLQQIAHPENHDGMDVSALPPICEAVLTHEEVNLLFADVESLATDIVLMQRSSRSASATGSSANSSESLQAARTSLLGGGISRLQIRYRWQEAAWIDTLETRPDGFRLVRIAHR